MLIPPSVSVVIVDPVRDRAADDLADTLHDPFAAGMGIAPGELHRGDVAAPDLAVFIDTAGGPFMPSRPPAALR
jgi:hypothetical protein